MSALEYCLTALHQGEVIAYPTEAVFGLGCDPDSQQAVEQLLTLKQRPVEKGLILIAADYAQLQPYVDESRLMPEQMARIAQSWPGPVTWVVPAKSSVPRWLTGQFDSIAVRVSDHPDVRRLCHAFGKPLTSTSANLTGLPPCRLEQEVVAQFGTQLAVLSGLVGGRENPSEIRDAKTGSVLRPS